MKKTLYNDGVEVRSVDFNNTERTKIDEILQRSDNLSRGGIVSGLVVTVVNAGLRQLQITKGFGYITQEPAVGAYKYPDTSATGEIHKERVQLDSTVNPFTLPAGAGDYYIYLNYISVDSNPQPHESDIATLYNTRNAPKTDSSILSYNLGPDAGATGLLIAIVTVSGGVIVPPVIQYISIRDNNLRYAVNQPVAITGVKIIGVSDLAVVGTYNLNYVYPAQTLAYNGGIATPIGAGGIFSIVGGGLAGTLTVLVDAGVLPGSSQSDNIVIKGLYQADVQSFTARDRVHASFVGAEMSTPTNPHGLSIADIPDGDSLVVRHRDLQHANGIISPIGVNSLSVKITRNGVQVDVAGITAGDNLYIKGKEVLAVSGTPITLSDVNAALFQIYIDSAGVVRANKRYTYADKWDGPLRISGVYLYDIDPRSASVTLYFDRTLRTLRATNDGINFGPSIPVDTNPPSWPTAVFTIIDNSGYWIHVLVNPSLLPPILVGTVIETFSRINVPVSTDTYLDLGNAVWAGDAPNFIIPYTTPWDPTSTVLLDRRTFGTLEQNDTSTRLLFGNRDGGNYTLDMRNKILLTNIRDINESDYAGALWQVFGNGVLGSGKIRFYRSPNAVNVPGSFVITSNCFWNGSAWVADNYVQNNATTAVAVAINENGATAKAFRVLIRTTTGAAWTGWDAEMYLNMFGDLAVTRDLAAFRNVGAAGSVSAGLDITAGRNAIITALAQAASVASVNGAGNQTIRHIGDGGAGTGVSDWRNNAGTTIMKVDPTLGGGPALLFYDPVDPTTKYGYIQLYNDGVAPNISLRVMLYDQAVGIPQEQFIIYGGSGVPLESHYAAFRNRLIVGNVGQPINRQSFRAQGNVQAGLGYYLDLSSSYFSKLLFGQFSAVGGVLASSGGFSVTPNGGGNYSINFTPAWITNAYCVVVTPAEITNDSFYVYDLFTTGFRIQTNSSINHAFSFIVIGSGL